MWFISEHIEQCKEFELCETRQSLSVDVVPGQPRRFRVEVLNSSAVIVHWRPPDDRLQRHAGLSNERSMSLSVTELCLLVDANSNCFHVQRNLAVNCLFVWPEVAVIVCEKITENNRTETKKNWKIKMTTNKNKYPMSCDAQLVSTGEECPGDFFSGEECPAVGICWAEYPGANCLGNVI